MALIGSQIPTVNHVTSTISLISCRCTSLFYDFLKLVTFLVSTLEKRSKKSPSPPQNPPSSQINHNSVIESQTDPNSHHLIANSLESDDDAGKSSTTTTSSSFVDGKRILSFDEGRTNVIGSNTSLNKSEIDAEGAVGEICNRYKVEQQRRGSISTIGNSLVNPENKVKYHFFEKRIIFEIFKNYFLNRQNCHLSFRN
jgi:hypothetical protein